MDSERMLLVEELMSQIELCPTMLSTVHVRPNQVSRPNLDKLLSYTFLAINPRAWRSRNETVIDKKECPLLKLE